MPIVAANLSPSLVPLLVVSSLAFLVAVGLVLAIGGAEPPGPAEVAVAYEHAWDRLDFANLWNLSSPRLRDGRTRIDFVRDKESAYATEGSLTRLVRTVRPERVDVNGPVARVFTRLELADGQTMLDEMLLEKLGGNWFVTAYHIASPQGRT